MSRTLSSPTSLLVPLLWLVALRASAQEPAEPPAPASVLHPEPPSSLASRLAPPREPPAADLSTRSAEGAPEPAPEPPPRWAPIFTASSFSRYEARQGYDDLGISRGRFLEGDAVFYRARFGLNTGLLDVGNGLAVALQFTPQAAGTFGDDGPNTIVDAQLGLHEGFARVQGRRVRLDAGRYEMLYGDALMIGNNDWSQVGRTFDGVRMRVGGESWLDLFANLVDEGRPDFLGTGQGDLTFVGAYAALGPLVRKQLARPALADLDLYLLTRVWGVAKDVSPAGYRREGAHELTLGARGKGRIEAFDYRAETGVQVGTRPGAAASTPVTVEAVRARAWQGDLELGLIMLGDRLRVALEALYASGADPRRGGRARGWQELFPSGHKWLGLSDAFNQDGQKRTNVASAAFHFTANPLPSLTMQFDAHVFARPQPMTVGGPDGLAGGELDLGVVYVLAKGLKLRALCGVFLPSATLYSDVLSDRPTATRPDPARYFEAELRYDLAPPTGGSR